MIIEEKQDIVLPIPEIHRRPVDPNIEKKALALGLDPLAASIFAARDIPSDVDLNPWFEPSLKALDSPETLADIDKATERLIQAMVNQECIGIETDHDCDGQTSHAVLYGALVDIFKHPKDLVRSYIGHRLNEGYGLSEPLVDRILADEPRPTLVITADNGSSDQPRIHRLKEAGIDVIVTDHHAIPEEGIPKSAFAVLNPTREDCAFPDPCIAGCMVAWLWMAWTRRQLHELGKLKEKAPSLATLLDYVAVGTVADCVSLSKSLNNRLVIKYGMQKIARFERPCWRAIRDLITEDITSEALGFKIGPLLNSDGRLACAFGSVSFLLSGSDSEALKWVRQLQETNVERKAIQKNLTDMAVAQVMQEDSQTNKSICVYLKEGHPGVHGITASRVREMFGKPTFIFSPKANEPGLLSGSGRSTETCHLREALQWVADRHPSILSKFGGHQGAAGATLLEKDFPAFKEAFEQAIGVQIDEVPKPILLSDGPLPWDYFSVPKIEALMAQLEPFGRAFESPLFEGTGDISQPQWLGESKTHLRFELLLGEKRLPCIWFQARQHAEQTSPIEAGDRARVIYALNIDTFRDRKTLKGFVRYAQPLA